MNYPWKKKHTICRLLSLAVALTLICGLTSGCSLLGSKEPTDPDPGPNLLDNTTPSAPAASTDPVGSDPAASGEDKTNIAIVKEQVNVRSSPMANANVLSTLEAGEEVEVRQRRTVRDTEWVDIKQGWVPAASLDMSNVTLQLDDTATPNNPDSTEPSTAATEPTASSGNEGNGSTGTNVGSAAESGSGNAVVIATQLNVRESPTTDSDKVGSLSYGDRVTITDTQDGWGKIAKGWIYLKYVYRDGDTGSNGCTGTVTATQLNKRAGPGTKYDKTGSLNQGDTVNVLQRVTINGTDWGYVTGGWISMDYVDTGDSSGSTGGTSTTGNGTITAENGLNIRSGPGTDYDSVGGLKKGDRVSIIEQKDGWGRISEGWISMKYVKMD